MVEKKRVLLDTNVYSALLEGWEFGLLQAVQKTDKVAFYGFSVVRDELRRISRHKKQAILNYRALALQLYDDIVKGHSFEVTPLIVVLANEYAKEFRGNRAARKLRHDFLIVACASFHDLDVLVSDDAKTMFSTAARTTYGSVNKSNQLRTPHFYGLRELKKLV